ncbi:hypothetical protein TNCV_1080871 [Trichonephila clavipes]|uniref:C2H2-type domain-containing protein n=1 Tax=Trichonephila clavipes TaxID=2585209 RepID=A0A8X6RR32_TRICX|nr:hypothetical protein TNCV_1080871 [Trichonephila clavipes]
MAKGNVYPSDKEYSYFCFDCRNTTQATEKDFFYVGALGPCYTCTQCGNQFDAGFREKIDSSEETISYICPSCKKNPQGTNCNFIFVGSLGFCFTCTQCGEKIDYGFKIEKHNLSDTPSHRCDICGKTFQKPYRLLYLSHSYDHSNEWSYRCSVCQKGFATRSDFESHKKRLDTIWEIECIKCSMKFRGNCVLN